MTKAIASDSGLPGKPAHRAEKIALPPLKLKGESDAPAFEEFAETAETTETAESTEDAVVPDSIAARPRASLSSKLTAAEVFDAAADEPDNADEPEPAAPEAEDDDPGPLTQTILESRARQDEKPGRSQARAFPWLRR
jgi:hypothetical protein